MESESHDRELLTPGQLADYLGVSTRTVRNWTSRRIIPVTKIGRITRYNRHKVTKALEAFETKSIADANL